MNDDHSLATPTSVTVAAFTGLVAGLFSAATGAQPLLFVYVLSVWVNVLLWALILIGTGLLTLAALSVRARPVVTIAATLASGLLTLLLLVWGIWATTHGFFALLPFITAALCGASTLLLSVSLPAVLRVSAARRALLAD